MLFRSTAYGIARQSGGHLAVVSAPGQGTRFTVWLPRVESPPRAPSRAEDPGTDPLRGEEALLLVEDQDGVRASLRAILTRFGYRVHDAPDAATALAFAADHPEVARVITDVVMPRMGGRALVERLRATRPELPVILMSGYAEDFPMTELEGRGTVCLQKPFAPEVLLRRIRELLAKGGAESLDPRESV